MRYWIGILSLALLAACGNNQNGADAYGNFEATEIIVSAEANGQIVALDITEGQQVETGKPIGLIDTTQLHLKKEQLLASMEAVKAKTTPITAQIRVLEEQKKNLVREQTRVTNLVAKEAATQKQLDDINGQINVVEQQMASTRSQNAPILAELKNLQTQVAQLSDQIERCIINSPVSGTVLTRFAEAGEVIAFGRPLFKVADLENMELRVYLTGEQLAEVQIGQQVQVQYTGGDQSLSGTVTWISSEAEFTPRTIQTREERTNLVYAVKIRVANNGQLKIGMPADVQFTAKSED